MENQNDICSECLSFELYTKYKEAYADKPAMIKLFELDKPWILKEKTMFAYCSSCQSTWPNSSRNWTRLCKKHWQRACVNNHRCDQCCWNELG